MFGFCFNNSIFCAASLINLPNKLAVDLDRFPFAKNIATVLMTTVEAPMAQNVLIRCDFV